MESKTPTTKSFSFKITNGMNWHERTGHSGHETLMETKGIVTGLDYSGKAEREQCKGCLIQKATRSSKKGIKEADSKIRVPLQLLHSDVCGPITPISKGAAQYFVTLYDDYTAVSMVRFTKSKDQTLDSLKEGIAEIEAESGKHRVKRIRMDNGGEFEGNNTLDWFRNQVIHPEYTTPYSPESNGRAERLNRTLLDRARTMINMKGSPQRKTLWADGVCTANYIRNRMYSSACQAQNVTAIEALTGVRPDISHFKSFGCRAIICIPSQTREGVKLATRGEEGILVGYGAGNAFKIFIPSVDKFRITKDVKFMDGESTELDKEPSKESVGWEEEEIPEEQNISTPVVAESEVTVSEDEINCEAPKEGENSGLENLTYYPNVRRSTRKPVAPDRYSAFALTLRSIAGTGNESDPLTYQAVESDERENWEKAMREKIKGNN